MELTQEYLKSALHYDPETGIFTWLTRDLSLFKTRRDWAIWNTRFSGKVAGSLDSLGYVRMGLFGKDYRAHRLAFLYMHGNFPPDQTDHINGNRQDNRWANLRAVTSAGNNRNTKIRSTNKSGVLGVSWHAKNKKWCVYIQDNGRSNYLGSFANIEDAKSARKEADYKCGFHPNHGRVANNCA